MPIGNPYDIPQLGVPQQCGRCGHEHAGPKAAPELAPACLICDCTTYRLHPSIIAATSRIQQIEREAGVVDPILPAEHVLGIAGAIRGVEADAFGHLGWSTVCQIGVMTLAGYAKIENSVPGFPLKTAGVYIVPLQIPDDWWQRAGNTPTLLAAMARLAERQKTWFGLLRVACGINPADPVIGWWAIQDAWLRAEDTPEEARAAGYASDDPNLRVGDKREWVAADVDGRVYHLTRTRVGTVGDGEVGSRVILPPSDEVAGDLGGPLRRLARVCRGEVERAPDED